MTNKRGDITITILVIGVIVICGLAVYSFFSSMVQTRNSFIGIGIVDKMNMQV
jgi:hypothetical protein